MPPVIGESFKGDQSQNLAFKKINLEGIDLAIQQNFLAINLGRLLLESDLSINTVCTNFLNEDSELLYLFNIRSWMYIYDYFLHRKYRLETTRATISVS